MKRDDDAYLWARWLAPVYSVMVANVKAALRLQVGAWQAWGAGGLRSAWQPGVGKGRPAGGDGCVLPMGEGRWGGHCGPRLEVRVHLG